jgi:DNA helicase-2/ATP-dependent DNA helicase PcrA
MKKKAVEPLADKPAARKKPARASAAPPPRTARPAEELNASQQQAVRHGRSPLLIIAGAGTGKTTTLAHRVAHLIGEGTPPERILLLTFTRRAAEDLLHRVEAIRAQRRSPPAHSQPADKPLRRVWGGTFHAVAARLLRIYGRALGVEPSFVIHDREDSETMLDLLRTEMKLAEQNKEFPKKGTCIAVHSGWVNSGKTLTDFLRASFTWCLKHQAGLELLFAKYEERKRQHNVFDFDDLLIFQEKLLADSSVGDAIRGRFDCVLVDEYQDTNPIQSRILTGLRPDGSGVTVVGDDAQSIYSFRGATVRNILDFPQQFPNVAVVRLEDNYRSTEPILDATNEVIAQASEGFAKELRTTREGGTPPQLVACWDEYAEARYVVDAVERHGKAGSPLRQQAVLFRASHHSLAVEMELARRGIPFHKYGGLKFAEAAHVKDLVAFLRLAENPPDAISGQRIFKLLPGVGPKKAQALHDALMAGGGQLSALAKCKPPAATAGVWPGLCSLFAELTKPTPPSVPDQVGRVLKFYAPLLRAAYDDPEQRLDDLKKLEELAGRFEDRTTFLADFTLDPPTSTFDVARGPAADKDFLVLSTIHSAKGLEWEAVFVINATEGGIPSSRALETPGQIDEELRLFYVALTRARTWLTVTWPRSRSSFQGNWDQPPPELTRFLPAKIKRRFDVSNA